MPISSITEKETIQHNVVGRMVQYDEQHLSGPRSPDNDVPGPARTAQAAFIRLGQQVGDPGMGQADAVALESLIDELPQQIANNIESPPLVPKSTINWLSGTSKKMEQLAATSPLPDAAANAANIKRTLDHLLEMLDEEQIYQEVVMPSVSISNES
jgi:hypothetical protein